MKSQYKQLSELVQMGLFGAEKFPKQLFEKYWNYPVKVIKCMDVGAFQIDGDLSYIEHKELRDQLSNN